MTFALSAWGGAQGTQEGKDAPESRGAPEGAARLGSRARQRGRATDRLPSARLPSAVPTRPRGRARQAQAAHRILRLSRHPYGASPRVAGTAQPRR
jgi:hypothetical protein